MQNTVKQNYPGSVASYSTQPGNKMCLLYNAPEPTWGEFWAKNTRFVREIVRNALHHNLQFLCGMFLQIWWRGCRHGCERMDGWMVRV